MPWTEATKMSLRKEFVRLANREETNMAELCRRYGISRKTGYKWLRRWQEAGDAGLDDRSRRPHHSPRRTPRAVEEQVLRVYSAYPAWGGRKLRARMERMVAEGRLSLTCDPIPAANTITRILRRYDVWESHSLGAPESPATQRFERPEPNDLWQVDFKGEFLLENQQRCYPLTVVDDHSRYDVGLRSCSDIQRLTVQAEFTTLFRRYGLPRALLIDHGPPWGSGTVPAASRPVYTRLHVWWLRLGIHVIYARPFHPQTKGKNERFNGTLQAELLRYESFRDGAHAQERFDWWRDQYNNERPHQALDDAVPADRYTPSPRPFPPELPPIEYGPDDTVRKVDKAGKISWHGTPYRVGKAFAGFPVAVRPQTAPRTWRVYFCQHAIRKIEVE